MYHIDIYKVLKNGPKIKAITSFERGEHIEYKYILKNNFHFFKIPKKGAKPKIQLKLTLNGHNMTSEVKVDL